MTTCINGCTSLLIVLNATDLAFITYAVGPLRGRRAISSNLGSTNRSTYVPSLQILRTKGGISLKSGSDITALAAISAFRAL